MTLVATVVFFIAIAASVLGQVDNITSDLAAAGRNFSCTGDVVTYTCSGQGTTLFVNFPPLFDQQGFISIDLFPSTVDTAPSALLTLTSRMSLTNGMSNYTANLQITVSSDPEQRVNVSCSTDISGPLNNFVLPLIHESQIIKLPSTVTLVGLTGDTTRRSVQVIWTPPVDPQFDIDSYLVRIYINRVLYTTRKTSENSLDVDVPSGEISADVRTVTTCGSISAARLSDGSVSGQYSAFYAAFLVPTFIGVLLIVAVVLLTIFLVRASIKISKSSK